jgi:hypothetical protein
MRGPSLVSESWEVETKGPATTKWESRNPFWILGVLEENQS